MSCQPGVLRAATALGARPSATRTRSRTPQRAPVVARAFDQNAPAPNAVPEENVPAGAATRTTVAFAVRASLDFGFELVIVGSDASLGAWNPDGAARLTWSEGDVWVGAAIVESAKGAAADVEFKLVVAAPNGGGYDWEECENRVLPASGVPLMVTGALGGDVRVAAEDGSAPKTSAPASSAAAAPIPSSIDVPRQVNTDPPPEPTPVMNSADAWRGQQTQWMQHRDESMEAFQMDVVKNRVPEDYVASRPHLAPATKAVIAGSREAPSYLTKLELIQSIVGQGHELSVENLAATSTFLRWIAAGHIECAEDGHHHRPDRPAVVSRDVFINLETVAGLNPLYGKHGAPVSSVERQLMRHLHPWLPSFSSEFTCSVPMTRIRDIAHRNDIPQDLKKEIKHTLQNKIHRNAGPEDLIAVDAMLKRLTVDAHDGQYNHDFVHEFCLFAAELKKFFNATGALERVDALRPSVEPDAQAQIDELQGAMWALESGEAGHDGVMGAEGAAVMRALRASVSVRRTLGQALETGMRNDAPDEAVATRQEYRLAEIALEELAFVVMARALQCSGAGVDGEADNAHFVGMLQSGDQGFWRVAAEATAAGLRHVAVGGWRAAECEATASELETWCGDAAVLAQSGGSPIGDREAALRVRATLQRARRVVESHADALSEAYGNVPVDIADAFGLPEHLGVTHVEAIVRAGVPFQISRYIAPMLRAASDAAGVRPGGYDAVSGGVARGVLVECQSLQPGSLGDPLTSGPVVALAWTADGDEEVRAAGAHVKGVVLARDLPHLSHLAIRARQEKTPLAATEDAAAHAAARALLGREVILEVTPDGATLRAATAADVAAPETADASAAGTVPSRGSMPSPDVTMSNKLECHPLERATTETAGAKAATCAELRLVAARSDSLFKTPPGVFVPFGVMETVCENAGLGDALRDAAAATGAAAAGGDPEAVEAACDAARALIRGVDFPSDLAAQIAAAFPDAGATRVVVRSSANVEDLAGMSAAGLYESEIGVSTASAAELGAAVREVWASLFSRRAVLARHIAGVPPEQAKMAVFVQEMAPAELSFVLHTRSTKARTNVTASDADGESAAPSVSPTLEAEIAVGLGETLASGAQGSPWRVEVCQQTGAVSLSAFASIGTALVLRPAVAHLGVRSETVDYSAQPLSVDVAARNALGARLAAIGAVLEAEYQSPQDVEGTVVGEQVYIVQTRPQPL